MMSRIWLVGVLLSAVFMYSSQAVGEGNAVRGEKLFNGFLKCYTCHSLEPGVTKVGPTFAGLFGRKAGSAEGFEGYSEAMIRSGVIWDAVTLDAFMSDPQKFIPGNSMMMDGYYVVGQVSSASYRADVIAYLSSASAQ